jgi:hypothetical protein
VVDPISAEVADTETVDATTADTIPAQHGGYVERRVEQHRAVSGGLAQRRVSLQPLATGEAHLTGAAAIRPVVGAADWRLGRGERASKVSVSHCRLRPLGHPRASGRA